MCDNLWNWYMLGRLLFFSFDVCVCNLFLCKNRQASCEWNAIQFYLYLGEGWFLSMQQKFRQQVCGAQELSMNLFCAEEFYI